MGVGEDGVRERGQAPQGGWPSPAAVLAGLFHGDKACLLKRGKVLAHGDGGHAERCGEGDGARGSGTLEVVEDVSLGSGCGHGAHR